MMRQVARNFVQLVVLAVFLTACGTSSRQQFTAAEQSRASVGDVPSIRFWADSPDLAIIATRYSQRISGQFSYLALSGGGGDGAYGAGFLKGWSQTGKRPEFTIVSGVSTGALIAPFAFLGSAYDETLQEIYTGGYGITLVDDPDPIGAIFGPGVFDSRRLLTLSRKFVTADVIAAVAREHRKGRRLLVLTTNIDAQRPVIWNLGAIAASNLPGADELFRTVLTASASIPGIFAPTMIRAASDGHVFEEMHVDGGVFSNVFILPDKLLANGSRLSISGRGDIYVIMNGKLDSSFHVTNSRTFEIVGRSVTTMIASHSRATLESTYAFARQNNLGFHLAYIPSDVDTSGTTMFDTDEMRKLYARGYERGLVSKSWVSRLLDNSF